MWSNRCFAAALFAICAGTACGPRVPLRSPSTALPEATDSAKVVAKLLHLENVASRSPLAWPGFTLDSLVIVTSLRQTGPVYLLGDAAPPAGFVRLLPSHSIFVQPGAPPDSITGLRIAMDWNGRSGVGTALSAESGLLEYLPYVLVHEAFHTFQEGRRGLDAAEFPQRSNPKFPTDNVEAIALLNLEGRYLGEALRSADRDSSSALAKQALAVREYRCARLATTECGSERAIEQNEGTADYVAAFVTGEVAGYGSATVWRDSLARAIASVQDTERLSRWHFYATGLAWINLVERFSSGGDWKARVALSPPDEVLRAILSSGRTIGPASNDSIRSGARWSEAHGAAVELVRRETAKADSADRAFFARPGVPVRVYFGRVRSMSTEQGQTPGGLIQRRIEFDGAEVVFRGPSRQICCPVGEMTIAEVRGAKVQVDGRAVRLDQPGRSAGELRLDLGAVALWFERGEIYVSADSITISAQPVR